MKKLVQSIEKFSFAQLTSNTSGKTSASGTMGVIICAVGSLCFLIGCVDKLFIGRDIDIITQSIIFVGIGAGLLGLRKVVATNTKGTIDISSEVTNP
jgi:hypothetical protein